ncbi:MAG: EAL domain-containing response regulator [Chloroflexi bacterium]|nr:EAL domain-containing response regulator [Chloroflexota bacterium]
MTANRLLILEDDPRILDLVVAAGEAARYAVTPTEAISQFRQAFEAAAPSLIVIDLQSQAGLGSDLLLYLQRIGCAVPIIVIGGADAQGIGAVRQAKDLTGLTILGTLAKPFPSGALAALLEIRREPDLDEWAAEIHAALEAGQLGVHYLPIAEFATGNIVGFEALARWFHPRRGLISPGRFIPLAEATGQIVPLTDYVLARAVENCAAWAVAGHELSVSVNVAATSLTSTHLLDGVSRLLAEHGVPARSLTLEVSESAAMRQPELTSEILARLQQRGVRLALDDFGTGYTNLKVLSQIPFDMLKIDRSFVTDVSTSRQNQVIVRAIAALAGSLGHAMVAEGVETAACWRWLAENGVQQCQGFVLARPMPSDRVLDWLAGYKPPV